MGEEERGAGGHLYPGSFVEEENRAGASEERGLMAPATKRETRKDFNREGKGTNSELRGKVKWGSLFGIMGSCWGTSPGKDYRGRRTEVQLELSRRLACKRGKAPRMPESYSSHRTLGRPFLHLSRFSCLNCKIKDTAK